MLPDSFDVIKALFQRGYVYEFDYAPLMVFAFIYLVFSAYNNGMAVCTGIVVPMLMNGALLGRSFGLIVVDMVGLRTGHEALGWEWVDPGVFALLGAASFFAGVTRVSWFLVRSSASFRGRIGLDSIHLSLFRW